MDRRGFLLPALLLAACGGARDNTPDASPADVPRVTDADTTLGAPTCALATPVGDGTLRHGESLGNSEENTAGCLARVRSIAYRITVPAGRTLTARVPAATGPVVLQVVEDCAATACLAQSSTSGVAPLRAVWRNDGAAPREVRVLAGSFSAWEGTFSIGFSMEDSPENLRCETAEALVDGDWRGEQPFGPSATAAAQCSDREAPAAAGMRWYRVTLPPDHVAVATLTPAPAPQGREYGVVAVMRDDCATDRCVAATSALARARTALVGSNPTSAPRELRVGVGVYPPLAEGRYSLAMQVRPRPAGTVCAEAAEVPPDTDVSADTALSPTTLAACGALGGPVRFHSVTVPPGRFLDLRATAPDGRLVALRALASCAATACLTETQYEGNAAILRLPNLGAEPLRVVVAAGARDANAQIAYTLRATLAAPDPAGRCEGAEPVTPGRSAVLDTWRVTAPAPACGTSAQGPARWLRITLPPSTALRITATPQVTTPTTSPMVLRVLDGCDATACLAAGATQVAWSNLEDRAREIVVAVGAQAAGARYAFNLYTAVQPVPANSRCDRATAVPPGATVRNEMSNLSLATGPWCGAGETRLVRYYSTTVPPGQVLHAYAVNPFSTYSYGMPELSLRADCDAAACLARGGVPGSRGSHLWWRNESSTPRDVRVVAGWSSLSGNYYNLAAETFDPSPNGRCADAERVALPLSRSVDLAHGDAAPTPCPPSSRSPVSWFVARVEPGRTLRVAATLSTAVPTARLFVDLLDACEATTCLASTGGYPTATATWRNDGDAPRDVRIAVRAGDDAPTASVALTADAM